MSINLNDLIIPIHSKEIAEARLGLVQYSGRGSRKTCARFFQIITRHLYREIPIEKTALNILVRNLSDGYGDNGHGTSTFHALKAEYPEMDICQITIFERKKNKIPSTLFSRSSFLGFSDKEMSSEELDTVKKRIHSAASLSISTPLWEQGFAETTCYYWQSLQKKPDSLIVREYGYSSLCDPAPWNELSMGLADDEEGIFLVEFPKSSLRTLQNEPLKNLLFGTPSPSEEEVVRYRESHHLHVGYIKSTRFFPMAFLYIAAHLHKTDNKPIDMGVYGARLGLVKNLLDI